MPTHGYFGKDEKIKAPFQSSAFPLDTKFEYKIFSALLLNESQLKIVNTKYNGLLSKYHRVIYYNAEMRRIDVCNAVMTF